MLNNLPTSLDVYSDKYLIVSSVEFGQSKIELYDNELLKTIVINANSNRPLDIIGKAIFNQKGNIIFSRTYINQIFEIETFTSDIKERSIEFLPHHSTTTINNYNMEIPDYAIIADVAKINNKILLLSGVFSKEIGQPIFGLDDNGNMSIVYALESPINMFSIFNNQIIGYDPVNRDIIIFDTIE